MTLALNDTRQLQEGLVATKSVTEGDKPPGVYYLSFYPQDFLNMAGAMVLPDLLPPRLPKYYSQASDYVLFEAGKFEGRWASAVATSSKKVASRAFELKSDKPQLLKRYSDLLHDLEGRGKSPYYFFQKLTRDYLGCDNGAWIEIDRQSSAAGSRIKGLYVLDSRRVMRTGDPSRPAVYQSLDGKYHEMKDYQVVDIVDNPDTTASQYGTGECAARRAYKSIRMMNAVDQFRFEKLTGARPLALDFITGITEEQVSDVLASQEAQRQAKGHSVYGGTVLIPLIRNEQIGHTRIDMASLPDNFDYEKERGLALDDYSNAIGLDRQELKDLGGGSALGTATQTEVLDDKAEGKGLVVLMLEVAHVMNYYVLPDTVTFYYSEKADYRDKKAQAEVFSTTIGALAQAVGKDGTVLDHNQALNVLVDNDLLDPKYLPPVTDLTPDQSVSDTERPEDLPEQLETPLPQPAQQQPPQANPVTQKALAILERAVAE